MNKLDEFAGWIGKTFTEAKEKIAKESVENSVSNGTKPSTNIPNKGVSGVKFVSRGSTGRTTSNDLYEQIAMKSAKSNPFDPGDGNTIRRVVKSLEDKRWLDWEKWEIVSRTNEGRKVTIHFNYDPINKLFDDFKFK